MPQKSLEAREPLAIAMVLPPHSMFAEFQAQRPAGPTFAESGGRIRAATPGDVDAVAEIAAQRDGVPVDQHRRAVQAFLDGGSKCLLVAELRGAVVGFGKIAHLAPDAGAGTIPEGWYLGGVIVRPSLRRRGVGRALTSERIAWLRGRTDMAYYFASAQNAVSIALHRPFGFVEIARNIVVPGATFTGGVGVLFGLDLAEAGPSPP